MTTIKSPVSTCGVNSGLCLPRKRRAISAASRPSTLPLASTRYQSRLTSCGLAERVVMALSAYVRDTAKVRDFNEEVAKCQTRFAVLECKKKRNPERLRQIHQRRRVEETNSGALGKLHRALTVERYYGDKFCAAQDIFVRRDIQAEFQR